MTALGWADPRSDPLGDCRAMLSHRPMAAPPAMLITRVERAQIGDQMTDEEITTFADRAGFDGFVVI